VDNRYIQRLAIYKLSHTKSVLDTCTRYRMAHFYVTLPSNSSIRYYPDNTTTRYTTRLENTLALTGDWEVGLVEIQYQHTWFNLDSIEGRVFYSHGYEIDDKPSHVQGLIHLPPGYYESPADIAKILNEHIEGVAAEYGTEVFAKFKYDTITQRFEGRLSAYSNISFTLPLCDMLGLTHDETPILNSSHEPLMWKANNVCDVNRGFSSMYVYCDVLEHVLVGDTKTPLLRIVQVAGKGNDTIHARYEKPIYVPLQKKHFESIEIDIRTDTGKPIPFEYGKVIVTLHFRLRKVPYLLQ